MNGWAHVVVKVILLKICIVSSGECFAERHLNGLGCQAQSASSHVQKHNLSSSTSLKRGRTCKSQSGLLSHQLFACAIFHLCRFSGVFHILCVSFTQDIGKLSIVSYALLRQFEPADPLDHFQTSSSCSLELIESPEEHIMHKGSLRLP